MTTQPLQTLIRELQLPYRVAIWRRPDHEGVVSGFVHALDVPTGDEEDRVFDALHEALAGRELNYYAFANDVDDSRALEAYYGTPDWVCEPLLTALETSGEITAQWGLAGLLAATSERVTPWSVSVAAVSVLVDQDLCIGEDAHRFEASWVLNVAEPAQTIPDAA